MQPYPTITNAVHYLLRNIHHRMCQLLVNQSQKSPRKQKADEAFRLSIKKFILVTTQKPEGFLYLPPFSQARPMPNLIVSCRKLSRQIVIKILRKSETYRDNASRQDCGENRIDWENFHSLSTNNIRKIWTGWRENSDMNDGLLKCAAVWTLTLHNK